MKPEKLPGKNMPLDATYNKRTELLTVMHTYGEKKEVIVMKAHSGGWDEYRALPKGKWLIVENPNGDRTYFGLFYQDENVNDQFKHGTQWRDGIRLGFHGDDASHGCIMVTPARSQTFGDAQKNWIKIQKLIRTKRPKHVISYRNNESPRTRDNTKFHISSYGNMAVTD